MKTLIAALAFATLIAVPMLARSASAAPMSPASSSFGGQRLLTGEKLRSAAEMFDRARRHELFRNGQPGTGQCVPAGRRLR